MTLVYCGSLTSVRSNQQVRLACVHLVPRRCLCSFFWLKLMQALPYKRRCQLFLHVRAKTRAFKLALDWSSWKTASSLLSVRVRPSSGPPCALSRKELLAGWPPSKSVGLRPFQRRAIRVLLCFECPLLRESRRALHCTKLGLCVEPVLASVTADSPSSHSALFHQKAMRLPVPNPLVSPRSLRHCLQFWTSPWVHTLCRKSSGWTQGWRR